jgi:hypothetical protein
MLRLILFITLFASLSPHAFVGDYGVFTALLKKGSVIHGIGKSARPKRITKDIIVVAVQIDQDSSKSYLLDQNQKPLYVTDNINFESLNQVAKLHPKINPLQIHIDETTGIKIKENEDEYFSTFLSFGLSQGDNSLYSSLYNSTTDSVSYKSLYLKQYYQSKTFPIHIGFGMSYKQGTWQDENSNTLSTSAIYIGPTLYKSFFETKTSAYNVHLNFFQSLKHKGVISASETDFSTIGFRLEIEKEFQLNNHPLAIGINYSKTKSTVKSSTHDLISPVENQYENTIGFTLAYRFNWSI